MTHHAALKAVAALFVIALATSPAHAQTVDDIVARHLASRGGTDALRRVESQRMTGKVHTQGIELTMVLVTRRPNLSRQELTIEAVGAAVVEFSDHRPIGGALVPPLVRMLQPGQPEAEVAVGSVEFNVPTSESMFRRP